MVTNVYIKLCTAKAILYLLVFCELVYKIESKYVQNRAVVLS